MTYLPKIEPENCIVVDNLNSGYIRVYDRIPSANSTIRYTDYFVDKDYITRSGDQFFSNYSYSVNCQSHDNFTTDVYYRIDFDSVLITYVILCMFCFVLPLRLFFMFCRRLR